MGEATAAPPPGTGIPAPPNLRFRSKLLRDLISLLISMTVEALELEFAFSAI
jgi:hypothetical protein